MTVPGTTFADPKWVLMEKTCVFFAARCSCIDGGASCGISNLVCVQLDSSSCQTIAFTVELSWLASAWFSVEVLWAGLQKNKRVPHRSW